MKDSHLPKKKKRLFIRKKLNPKKKEEKIVVPQKFQKSSKLQFKITNQEKSLAIFLIPFTLLIVFLSIYTVNHRLEFVKSSYKLSNVLDIPLSPLPVLTNQASPVLSAKAAIVQDVDSQTVLFAKNSNLRFSTASTAKIMTALVALEYYRPDSVLTVKSYRVDGSVLSLQYGDKFYFNDLMYAMLLPSANDAAAAIADNYPGGRVGFVDKMNEKAHMLHLEDTHFSDSIGLDDDGNYSTVVDMARLSAIALKNSTFAQMVSTSQYTIFNIDRTHPYIFSNLNKLLGYNGVNGIKTGTTEGAGEVLVTSALVNGHTFIIITMNSQDRFGDTSVLLNFISANVRFVDLTH